MDQAQLISEKIYEDVSEAKISTPTSRSTAAYDENSDRHRPQSHAPCATFS